MIEFVINSDVYIKDNYKQLVVTTCDSKTDLIKDHVFKNVTLKSKDNNKYTFEGEFTGTPNIFDTVNFMYPDANNFGEVFEEYDGEIIATSGSELDTPREELKDKNLKLIVITAF